MLKSILEFFYIGIAFVGLLLMLFYGFMVIYKEWRK